MLNGRDVVVYIGGAQRPAAARPGLQRAGMRLPAHLAATGKAMLAFHAGAAVRASCCPRRADAHERAAARHRRASWSSWAAPASAVQRRTTRRCAPAFTAFGAPVFDAAGEPVAGIGVMNNKTTLSADAGAEHRDNDAVVARTLTQRFRRPAPGGDGGQELHGRRHPSSRRNDLTKGSSGFVAVNQVNLKVRAAASMR